MPADPRLALARKYHLDGLNDEAWHLLRDLAPDNLSADDRALVAGISCTHAQSLEAAGKPLDAIEVYRHAAVLAPDDAAVHNNLGALLMGQGRFAAAAGALSRSLQLDPDNVAARINLGVADIERGDVAAGLARLAQAPDNKDAVDNHLFASHYISDDADHLWRLHKAWGQSMPSAARPSRQPYARLRVGYVSPDFRRHSVSFFSAPLIANHTSAVEVFCYATQAAADDVTARFQAKAHWRDISHLDTASAVDAIGRDEIDVLIDLAGHTMGNRLDVFAARAAPVQVTMLGYPDTTGLSAMDARIGDAVTDPADDYASEKIIRLPAGLHCYAAPADAPGVPPPPCLTAGRVTFGSFNKLAKISAATVEMWANILKDVPRSRLLLKAKALTESETQDLLAQRFAAHGIDRERLDLRGWSPADNDHLAAYAGIDIALDTFPYNGTTTTCEALWMGVPVVTLAGRPHAARVGASLLTTVGAVENITATPRHYVERAAELASDRKGLAAARARLRAQVAASPLCDGPAYAKAVEAVYRKLTSDNC